MSYEPGDVSDIGRVILFVIPGDVNVNKKFSTPSVVTSFANVKTFEAVPLLTVNVPVNPAEPTDKSAD